MSLNLRQAVAFAILMGGDIVNKSPDYILEKARACAVLAVPEVLLDSRNRAKLRDWALRWLEEGDVWDTERDLERPASEVLEEG